MRRQTYAHSWNLKKKAERMKENKKPKPLEKKLMNKHLEISGRRVGKQIEQKQ